MPHVSTPPISHIVLVEGTAKLEQRELLVSDYDSSEDLFRFELKDFTEHGG